MITIIIETLMNFMYWLSNIILLYFSTDLMSGFYNWLTSCYNTDYWYNGLLNTTIMYIILLLYINFIVYLFSISYWFKWLYIISASSLYIYNINTYKINTHNSVYVDKYCIITNKINPLLDNIYFWRYMEYVIYILFNYKPKVANFFIENQQSSIYIRD